MITPPEPMVVTAWVNLLTPIFLGMLTTINIMAAKWAADRSKRTTTAVNAAAEAVATVKTDLVESHAAVQKQLQTIQNTADDTHVLVNSNMAVTLNIGAISARALALSEPTPENQQKLKEAEQKLMDHMARQVVMDRQVENRKDAGVDTPSVADRVGKSAP